MSKVRTFEDMERAVRAIATHFGTDRVFIIGSQSVLLEWPDAPVLLRTSGEIDAYPENHRIWEAENEGQRASEEINALFGWGSHFHETHGFYIDGVDEDTSILPFDWKDRAVRVSVDAYGKVVTAIAPSPEDLTVAKLSRLDDKDRAYILARHKTRPLDLDMVEKRFLEIAPPAEVVGLGVALIDELRAHSHGDSFQFKAI